MRTVIEVTNLSKAYQLGQINTGTLSSDIQRWWALKRGKEDPFLRIGEKNDRTSTGTTNVVWSLKDVNFDIQQGDSLGIIGRNGAGKSTLLKLLSRITEPTTGSIKIKGKIASLLEVGTGFHPELSGRDNIFLNGAILGMKKAEIKLKFDEIVDFSGVERYIDTPVKRYSSGMYVRLAFAVAAHLDSEILIVDEVLAVGDAEFQKRCLGKMNQLGSQSGRTIIFVSHNMTAIKGLCTKSIYLNKGEVQAVGVTTDIINKYLTSHNTVSNTDGLIPDGLRLHGSGEAKFISLRPFDLERNWRNEFSFREKISLSINLQVFKSLPEVSINVFLVNVYGERVLMFNSDPNFKPISINQKGIYTLTLGINETIMPGEYSFGLAISNYQSGSDIDFIETFSNIRIKSEAVDTNFSYPWGTVHGYVQPRCEWQIEKQ